MRRRTLAALPVIAILPVAVRAQGGVDEKSDKAKQFAYVADAKKVDKAKQPRYAPGQTCANCALYQGKPADKTGGCALFAPQQVAGPGWCNAWAKKG